MHSCARRRNGFDRLLKKFDQWLNKLEKPMSRVYLSLMGLWLAVGLIHMIAIAHNTDLEINVLLDFPYWVFFKLFGGYM